MGIATIEEKREAVFLLRKVYLKKMRELCKFLGVCDRCLNPERKLFTETKCKECANYMKKIANRIYKENEPARKKEKKEREIAKIRARKNNDNL